MINLDLAAKCEVAIQPERALDAEIILALDWKWSDWEAGEPSAKGMAEKYGIDWLIDRMTNAHNSMWRNLPRFTGSFDAAVKLLPEGWAIESLTFWPASPEEADNPTAAKSSVTIVGTSIMRSGKRRVWGHGGDDGRSSGRGATPALALCAAIIRSMER